MENEEIENELMALEAIYESSFTAQSITTDTFTLSFTYPEDYPDASPQFTLESELLDESQISELLNEINRIALENIGIACIYACVEGAKEYLIEEKMRQLELEQEAARREREEREEQERLKFLGTLCTRENFLAWNEKFLREIQSEDQVVADGKLTGRQLFEKDKSLKNSDAAFDGSAVVVDESLFEDLDGLEEEESFDVVGGFTEDD